MAHPVSKWILGDRAAKIPVTYGGRDIQQLAGKLSVKYDSLCNWRTTALAYAESERHTGNPFTVYEVFNHQPDRVELVKSKIWTVNEARAEIRIRNGTTCLGNSDDDSGWNDRSDLVGNHSPCIYRLLNDSGRVIRVGQAKGDLRKRLNGYHHESWWSEVAGVKTFAVSLQALTVAEANEIHRWHPRHNDHCPKCGILLNRR
jgi:hypothetical protein